MSDRKTTLRVMSYNLLADNAEGGYEWGTPIGERYKGVEACLQAKMPDVAGLQETTHSWYAIVSKALPAYKFVNSTDPKVGLKDDICTALIYNTETLELLENELIHYEASYWGIGRVRYINMGLFRHKVTGTRFIFICTHFDAGPGEDFEVCRLSQARELAAKICEYREKYACPIISVADYNCGVETEPYRILVNGASLTDADANCPAGFIDHILFSEGVTATEFAVIDEDYVRHSSDHLPIYAELEI